MQRVRVEPLAGTISCVLLLPVLDSQGTFSMGYGGFVDDKEDVHARDGSSTLVAWHCESLEYAEMVLVALLMGVPR